MRPLSFPKLVLSTWRSFSLRLLFMETENEEETQRVQLKVKRSVPSFCPGLSVRRDPKRTLLFYLWTTTLFTDSKWGRNLNATIKSKKNHVLLLSMLFNFPLLPGSTFRFSSRTRKKKRNSKSKSSISSARERCPLSVDVTSSPTKSPRGPLLSLIRFRISGLPARWESPSLDLLRGDWK